MTNLLEMPRLDPGRRSAETGGLEIDPDKYEVEGLISEKGWPDVVVLRKKTGWRCYWAHLIISDRGGGWGRIDAVSHERFQAIRPMSTGDVMGAFTSPEDALAALVAARDDDGFMPA